MPYLNSEYVQLQNNATTSSNPEDNVNSQNDVKLTKYSNNSNTAVINAQFADNCNAPGGSFSLLSNHNMGTNQPAPGISAMYSDFLISSFSEFWLHGKTDTPLPVEMYDFSSSCENNERKVSWTTASETNCDYYIVERSRTGEYWTEIAEVEGNGTTAEMNHYSIEDSKETGLVYYRLRQVDYNGNETLYNPISLDCNDLVDGVKVFPNPSKGSFEIVIQSNEALKQAQLHLQEINGKIIKTKDLKLIKGQNNLYFEDMNLSKGVYIIRIEKEGVQKFNPIKLIVN